MEAQVTVAGWVGTAIDLRDGEEGGPPWAYFRVAHTPRYLRDGEWRDRDTVWLSVNCYRALALNVAASVRKGDPVVVVGRLESRTRADKQTGEVSPMQVLVASAVGHDLGRGTSHFTKRVRPGREADDAPPEELGGAGEPGAEPTAEWSDRPVAVGVS